MITKEAMKPIRFPDNVLSLKGKVIINDIITTKNYVNRFTCETTEESLKSIENLRKNAKQNGVSDDCN